MIKAIAIDLDDTLLDTSGILVKKASESSFQILIRAGLRLTLAECEQQRIIHIKHMSHKALFKKLATEHGNTRTLASLDEAVAAFYDPSLPDYLPLLPGAKENLEYLKNKYILFLVTAGTHSGQQSKIKALGIESYFQSIYIVDSLDKKKKSDAFKDIINKYSLHPEELFCIGNSLLSEIKDALEIGAIACHFKFGEERGDVSNLKIHPQYTVYSHKELIPTCKL